MMTARMEAVSASTRALFRFVELWDGVRLHPEVCDFAFGNPQEVALPGFVAALQRHTQPRDKDYYAYKRSEPDAQAIVAKRLREWRSLPFEPEDIALTPGAFGAISTVCHGFIDPGDEVVFSIPPWFFYEPMILTVGGVPVKVPLRPDDNDLDVERIAAALTPRTRLVIVNTPHNPTGRIYPAATLERLAAVLTDASARFGRPILLLSDEPYARLVFSDAEFVSPAAFYPHTLIAYSYGKVLLTPGQRIGWLALAPDMPGRPEMRRVVQLAQMASGWMFPNALMQESIEDLEHLSIDLADLERKRNHMGGALQSYGYELRLPEGTFYLWVRSPDQDDFAFVQRLAERRVLVLPGSAAEGPGHFRISITASADMIDRSLPHFRAAVAG
jgi:aspartate aminotransferase